MNKETLKKAKEIEDYIYAANKMMKFISLPYPGICSYDDIFNTASLDKKTLQELKKAWKEILNKRIEELEKEIEQL